MSDAVRVFVGTPANNEDLECQAVLDFSLRAHLTGEIDLTWMMLSRDESSFWFSDPQTRRGWNTRTWATPFSCLRWGIPAACDFRGRAIYCDSDQIALADVRELWEQKIPDGKALLMSADGASCVMLMDCERMRDYLPPTRHLKSTQGAHREIRGQIARAAGVYRGDWNCRDGRGHDTIYDGDVKILHYTHIPTQPNHRHARERLSVEGGKHWYPGPDLTHPKREIVELFDDTLVAAVAVGRGPEIFRVSPEFGDYGLR